MFSSLRKFIGKPAPTPAPAAAAAPPAPGDAPASATVLVNAYATRATLPPIAFAHTLLARRDRSDPELEPHLRGFANYVMAQGDGQMTATRYQVLRHLDRVQQHVSLSIADAGFDALADWCVQANAVVFLADGSVRDPQGRRLVARGDGAVDAGAAVPYPAEALQRRERTRQRLAERGLVVMAGLPPSVAESELRLRGAPEAFGRAGALAVAAARSEPARDGDLLPAALLRERLPHAFDHLTPKEQAFLADDAPSPADVNRFGWGYESLAVLQWALGLSEALPFPDRICDAAAVTATMLSNSPPPRRLAMRQPSELLDELDLALRLHWIARQAQRDGKAAPAGFDVDVVQERHRVLNWLTRFDDSDWDDVDTPT